MPPLFCYSYQTRRMIKALVFQVGLEEQPCLLGAQLEVGCKTNAPWLYNTLPLHKDSVGIVSTMLPSQARAMITDAGQIVSWDQIQRKVWKDGDAGKPFSKNQVVQGWFKATSRECSWPLSKSKKHVIAIAKFSKKSVQGMICWTLVSLLMSGDEL